MIMYNLIKHEVLLIGRECVDIQKLHAIHFSSTRLAFRAQIRFLIAA